MEIIWATRGRTWGFRFLLDGGFDDPLPTYEEAFSGVGHEPELCSRVGNKVALRFPDPLGRQDRSGRTIPHEFVIFTPLMDEIQSPKDGQRLIWPMVAEAFKDVWESPQPSRVRI